MRVTAVILLLMLASCAADSILDDPSTVLYMTTPVGIRALHLSSDTSETLIPVQHAHDVAFDRQSGYLYWATKDRPGAGIFRSNMLDSGVEPVVTTGIGAVERIAIDWVGRHIYFIDSEKVRIVACGMEGTDCTIVVEQEDSDEIRTWNSLALDPKSRLMFWSSYGPQGIWIRSAGMDGTERTVVIKSKYPGTAATDLAVENRRIFWFENATRTFFTCYFNGGSIYSSKQEIVLHPSPYTLDVVMGTFFWSSPQSGQVFAKKRNDESNYYDRRTYEKLPVAVSGKSSPVAYGIEIQHPSKQPPMPNPCSNTTCSHVCLLSPYSYGGEWSCACPTGMNLDSDRITCKDSTSQISLLLVKEPGILYHFQRRLIGKDLLVPLTPENQYGDINAVAYDAHNNNAIYAKFSYARHETSIYSVNLSTKEVNLLFDGIDGAINGLDIDPYTGDVYYINDNSVTKWKSSQDQQVLVEGSFDGSSIALAPELDLMFVRETKEAIVSYTLDGGNRRVLVSERSIPAFDYYGGYLYLISEFDNIYSLERMNPDGTEGTVLHKFRPVHNEGFLRTLSVGLNAAFWNHNQNNRVKWMNKVLPPVFTISIPFPTVSLVVVENWASNSTLAKRPAQP